MRAYSGGMGKLLLVALVLGVAVYLTIRVIQRRGVLPPGGPGGQGGSGGGGRGGGTGGGTGPRPAPRRPVAPDDDEDFLRGLRPPRPSDPPAGEPPASGPTQNG